MARTIAHVRKRLLRYAEQLQELLIPRQGLEIEQHRARSVRYVARMHFAASQIENEPGVDGAERDFTLLCPLARTRNVVEQPFHLRRGEIGIEEESRLRSDFRFPFPRLQRAAPIRRSAILPDDGIVQRSAGCSVPDDRGLALIGN